MMAEDVRVDDEWVPICPIDQIVPNTGVCCLVGGKQVALFRLGNDALYAIGNFDPFSRANVLSRGIVGDRGGVPKVASPIYKQNFALATGECMDDPAVSVPTFAVRTRDGMVEISAAVTAVLPKGNKSLISEGHTAS